MANEQQTRYGYTTYDLINSVIGTSDPDTVQANTTEYVELLNAVRDKISEEYANTLNSVLTDPNAHNVLMPIILGYVTDYVNTTNDLTININRTAERIYQDMAGFGILTPYLNDPLVEEININAWNSIEVFWSDHSLLLGETFASPQECVDIIRKMVRIGGVHVDYSQPIIDSFIGDGTRISATLPPINQDTVGATASIRKQTYKDVTRESYLNMGFATPKVFDFIRETVLRAVSIGFAGSPGAGKTTFMTFLLKDFLRNKTTGNNRVITIEEAREIELSLYETANPNGGQPRMISRNIAWNTKSGEHPVSARQLIRHTLRYDPQIIVPAEMRGEEAIEAVESGLTGVQIISSFHAWGAKDGYIRVLSMCQMGKSTATESTLLQSIIRAFPLMVYIKKDDDGVRRIHEVFEATGVEDGKVVGNTLFRFVRTKVEEDTDGRIVKIYGKFVQFDSISKNLRHLLIQNGARKEFVDQYYFENPMNNPDHPEQYEESQVEIVTIQNGDEILPSAPSKADVAKPVEAPKQQKPMEQPKQVETKLPAENITTSAPQEEQSYPTPQKPQEQEVSKREFISPATEAQPSPVSRQETTPIPTAPVTEKPSIRMFQETTQEDETPSWEGVPAKVENEHSIPVERKSEPQMQMQREDDRPAQTPPKPTQEKAKEMEDEGITMMPQWDVAPRLNNDAPKKRGGFWGGVKKNREGRD